MVSYKIIVIIKIMNGGANCNSVMLPKKNYDNVIWQGNGRIRYRVLLGESIFFERVQLS